MARHSFAAAFAMNLLQGLVTRVSRQGSPTLVEHVLPSLMKRMSAFADGTNQILLDRIGRGPLSAYGA